MLKDRIVHKFYRTIAVGEIKKAERIEGFLEKNTGNNTVQILKSPSSSKGSLQEILSAPHIIPLPMVPTKDSNLPCWR